MLVLQGGHRCFIGGSALFCAMCKWKVCWQSMCSATDSKQVLLLLLLSLCLLTAAGAGIQHC
jgi:hypothetical protein